MGSAAAAALGQLLRLRSGTRVRALSWECLTWEKVKEGCHTNLSPFLLFPFLFGKSEHIKPANNFEHTHTYTLIQYMRSDVRSQSLHMVAQDETPKEIQQGVLHQMQRDMRATRGQV